MSTASAAQIARVLPDPDWRELSEHSLSALAKVAELRSFAQDEQLNGNILIVLEGLVGAVRGGSPDRSAVTALFLRGDLVDLNATPRDDLDSLVAFRPTRALVFAPEDFDAVAQRNRDLSMAVCASLRRQAFNLREHAAELFTKAPDQRLASFLLWLAQVSGGEAAGAAFDLPMRRYDLARYLGMQPETLSRKIKALVTEGAISQSSPSRLTIEDRAMLESRAGGARRVG
jgi:CRP-like cAMP-binding protein